MLAWQLKAGAWTGWERGWACPQSDRQTRKPLAQGAHNLACCPLKSLTGNYHLVPSPAAVTVAHPDLSTSSCVRAPTHMHKPQQLLLLLLLLLLLWAHLEQGIDAAFVARPHKHRSLPMTLGAARLLPGN